MTTADRLFPGQPVPALTVPTVAAGQWTLAEQTPRNFTMIVVYRGLHCSICSRYLADLDKKLPAFAERGVEVIAMSADPRDRAERACKDWNLAELNIGYEMPPQKAREWGLYLSARRYKPITGIEELPLFIEPGLFLVRPDKTLYWACVQTMPFARPGFDDVLRALDLVNEKNYPPRGEVLEIPETVG
ncbi:MAG: peroxiredoxin-like family protein [Hyphomicrobiales bacterium]